MGRLLAMKLFLGKNHKVLSEISSRKAQKILLENLNPLTQMTPDYGTHLSKKSNLEFILHNAGAE